MLTKERLDELLAYDPETGVFTWKSPTSNRVRVGDVAGSPNARGYTMITTGGRRYRAHRLAFLAMTGFLPENEVDHINGVRDDNRWANLRPATHAENGRNLRMHPRNTSGVTGVRRDASSNKWCAYIYANRKHISLGYFTRKSEAVASRKAAEIKYHGEFSAAASRSAA